MKVDPSTLRKGDQVRFNGCRAVYTIQWYEERRPGQMWLIVRDDDKGGQAKYVGPRPAKVKDIVTGKQRRLTPLTVHLVRR